MHSLSPSVKSGGYSTAGWSIQGDLVIDMRQMDDVKMLVPSQPAEQSSDEEMDASASTAISTSIVAPGVAAIDERAHRDRQRRELAEVAAASQPKAPMVEPVKESTTSAITTAEKLSRTRKADQAFGDVTVATPTPVSSSSGRRPSYADRRAGDVSEETGNQGIIPGSAKRRFIPLATDEADSKASLALPNGVAREVSDGPDQSSSESSTSRPSGPQHKPSSPTLDPITDQVMNSLAQQDIGPSNADCEAEKRAAVARGSTIELTSMSSRPSEVAQLKSMERIKSELPPLPRRASSRDGSGGSPSTSNEASGSALGSGSSAAHSTSESNTSQEPSSGDGEGANGRNNGDTVEWNPESPFEHQRWQRHHRPEGPSGPRLTLPTGPFVWRDAGGNAASFFGPSPHAGPSLFEPPRANEARSPELSLNSMQLGADLPAGPDPTTILAPGIHRDKYAVVSFGPGAGVRGVDTFTDRAGRLSEAIPGGTASERIVRGVPYHVPFSAYPVGSSEFLLAVDVAECR